MSKPETTEPPPEGYHFGNGPELLAIKHFPAVKKALYDLASLFITGPLRKEARRPEVCAAVAAIAQIANDMPVEIPQDQPVPIPTKLVTRAARRARALLLPVGGTPRRPPKREAPAQRRPPRKPAP